MFLPLTNFIGFHHFLHGGGLPDELWACPAVVPVVTWGRRAEDSLETFYFSLEPLVGGVDVPVGGQDVCDGLEHCLHLLLVGVTQRFQLQLLYVSFNYVVITYTF